MDYVAIKYDSNLTYYGQCRCCLAAGNHRDITNEYYWNGYKEVYCDIILDCFNVFMPTNINTFNLICDSCVDRLRNANEFKQLVVSTEQRLMDALLRDEPVMLVNVPVPEHTLDSTIGFKIEVNNVKESQQILSKQIANNTGSIPTDGGTVLNEIPTDGGTELNDVPTDGDTVFNDVTDDAVSPKVEIDSDLDEKVNEETMELEVLNDVVADQIIEIPQEDIENEVNNTTETENVSNQIVSEKMASIANVSAILENSNVTIFNSKTQAGLKTFFDNIKSLREDLKKDLKTILNKSSAESKNVRANNTLKPTDGGTVVNDIPTDGATGLNDVTDNVTLQVEMLEDVKEEMMELEVLNDVVNDQIIEIPPEEIDYEVNNSKIVYENLAHIANVTAILENSNITAFKSKTKSGFPCFYCKNVFDNLKSLRDHQRDEDLKKNLGKILNKYNSESLVVYADVTDLMCTLCDNKMAGIKELKCHLVNTHGIKLYNKIRERVVPFKLTENYYECQICNLLLETFGAIERHMNTHMRNYVCDNCGAGFATMSRLKTHIQSIHKEGRYPCGFCAKIFTTLQRLRVHIDCVHKMKKNRCPLCPERFSQYSMKQKHLVEIHGRKPILFKCIICSKSFSSRYSLSCHMKRRHLEQRDVS